MASSPLAGIAPQTASVLAAAMKSPAKIKAGVCGMRAVLKKHAEMSPEWAKERASKGGTSTRSRYGKDYYKFLADRRWNRYRQLKKLEEASE